MELLSIHIYKLISCNNIIIRKYFLQNIISDVNQKEQEKLPLPQGYNKKYQ